MGEVITKEFLLEQMGKLELNYGKDKFEVNQDVFELWFEMFKDCDKKILEKAVRKCLLESEFAPNVAGVMKYYKQLADAHYDYVDFIKHQYTLLRSVWEEPEDNETMLDLYAFSMRFPENQRRTNLVEYIHTACSFRHDCDVCARLDIPTIKEYIQGAR